MSHDVLCIIGKRDNISKEDLLTMGESINYQKAKMTIAEISEVVSQ